MTLAVTSRPFQDVKWAVLQLCGRREHLAAKFHFFLYNLQTVSTNLLPQELLRILLAANDCRNGKIHFQEMISMSLNLSLLKLPIV